MDEFLQELDVVAATAQRMFLGDSHIPNQSYSLKSLIEIVEKICFVSELGRNTFVFGLESPHVVRHGLESLVDWGTRGFA